MRWIGSRSRGLGRSRRGRAPPAPDAPWIYRASSCRAGRWPGRGLRHRARSPTGPGQWQHHRLRPQSGARGRHHARAASSACGRDSGSTTAGGPPAPTATAGRSTPRPTGPTATTSANPELHFRWAVARAARGGARARASRLPSHRARVEVRHDVRRPVRAAAAGIVGIDTGVYVPVIFYDPTLTVVSIPVHLWIQASSSRLAGAAVRAARRQPGRHARRIPARLRPGQHAQPIDRSAHLVPLPRHGPERGRALLGRRHRPRVPLRVS